MTHPAAVRSAPLLLLLALLVPPAALAGGPDVRVEGERVVADLVVSAAEADVRALVDDPWRIAALYDGENTTITRVASGDCDTLYYAVDSFIGEVTYNVRFCVGPSGARAVLAEPLEDMKAYEATWQVTATDAGTRIHYELHVVPAMKLPRRAIRGSTRRSVKKLFVRLAEELGG